MDDDLEIEISRLALTLADIMLKLIAAVATGPVAVGLLVVGETQINQRHRFALRRKRLVFHGLSTFSPGLTLQPTASVHKRIMVFIAQN